MKENKKKRGRSAFGGGRALVRGLVGEAMPLDRVASHVSQSTGKGERGTDSGPESCI